MILVSFFTPDGTKYNFHLTVVPTRNAEILLHTPMGPGLGTVDSIRWVLNPSGSDADQSVQVWLRDWKPLG